MSGQDAAEASLAPSGSRGPASDNYDPNVPQRQSMRPPPLPTSRAPQPPTSTYSSDARSPYSASPQLPGLRQFTRDTSDRERLDDNHRAHPSSDRSSDSSYGTYLQPAQQQFRSPAPYHRDDRTSASASPRPPPGRSIPSSSTASSEAMSLHELRTSPSAPPPVLSGLPRHSTENRTYRLIIRQQPQQGRLCGLGSKDKRPLDPLPILQLRILKPDGTEDEDAENSPNLILQVTLHREDPLTGTHTEAVLVDTNDIAYPMTRMLEGRLVASANVARDLDGSRACFFVFTDLSIRQEGQFRLAFKLLALAPPGGGVLAEALTEPFTIYSPRRFPGMTESTELAKLLAKQGIQVPLRNDVRRGRQDQSDVNDDLARD
ncbi:Velvet factor [Kalmanozyma brasiliensis GHG001]|uniref:Velvet factor n=1 Tax=Kalmanozyma brasiliensis (strain GHG001) TaxID=1365824 RepID=UPI00286836DC|nr:Velvet factor [Kalmanozyma brasiliensis GHG001]EST09017.2 Velvet factor [Kalmanozyma brasiliensis GHG001]